MDQDDECGGLVERGANLEHGDEEASKDKNQTSQRACPVKSVISQESEVDRESTHLNSQHGLPAHALRLALSLKPRPKKLIKNERGRTAKTAKTAILRQGVVSRIPFIYLFDYLFIYFFF